MKEKRIVYTFFGISLGGIFLFIGLMYAYDPLQLFHKSWKDTPTFSNNMRLQAAGIINSYDFDSAIVGTSMLENTSAKEASEILGGKFVNISIEGSNFYERSLVMKYLLGGKKIERILYSVETSVVVALSQDSEIYKIENFAYLYDDFWLNDLKVYMSDKYIKCMMEFSDSADCVGFSTDIDRPKAWYMYDVHKGKFGGVDNWVKYKNDAQLDVVFKIISRAASAAEKRKDFSFEADGNRERKTREYLNRHLIEIVKLFPDTEFVFVIPPYSTLYYAIIAQSNLMAFAIHKQTIRYLVEMSETYPNMKLFAWGDHDFLDDISFYKDLKHYDHTINSWMLSAIDRNEGKLDNKNVETYLQIITEKAEKFDLVDFDRDLKKRLKEKAETGNPDMVVKTNPRLLIEGKQVLKEPCFIITPQFLARSLKRKNYLLKPAGNTIKVVAKNKDPIIHLPAQKTDTDGRFAVMVKMHSPVDTSGQLYYAQGKDVFRDAQMVNIEIKRGINYLYIPVNARPDAKIRLRFDPGSEKTTYTIFPIPDAKKKYGKNV